MAAISLLQFYELNLLLTTWSRLMTNSKTIKAISLGAAVTAAMASGVASAELTANAGIYSNYIWRGTTQTQDQAAGQGGIDYGIGGFYAGTWLSNVDFGDGATGYEMDVYGGFAGEAGSFGYDLGVITYQYPVSPSDSNFTEVYAAGSIAGLTAGIWYTVDKASQLADPGGNDDDIYLYGAYDFTAADIDYSIYIGNYSFDADSSGDYTHYGASIGKGGFSFAVDKNDLDDETADNVRFTVGYTVDFELM
jgi:uncharacterized protein (TIGR02001 family)